jgi:hypothetical protein
MMSAQHRAPHPSSITEDDVRPAIGDGGPPWRPVRPPGAGFPPGFADYAAARRRFLAGLRADSGAYLAEGAIRAVFEEIE